MHLFVGILWIVVGAISLYSARLVIKTKVKEKHGYYRITTARVVGKCRLGRSFVLSFLDEFGKPVLGVDSSTLFNRLSVGKKPEIGSTERVYYWKSFGIGEVFKGLRINYYTHFCNEAYYKPRRVILIVIVFVLVILGVAASVGGYAMLYFGDEFFNRIGCL